MSTQPEKQVQNGVNVEALLGARDALSKAPEAAKFNWRASCKWKNGTHSQTSIQGFYGLGQQQSHKTEFTFDTDHPEIFASEDKGATPVEMVLAGLAGCLTAGVASIAQLRKIQLRSVTATLEGAMDIQGILGVEGTDDVRARDARHETRLGEQAVVPLHGVGPDFALQGLDDHRQRERLVPGEPHVAHAAPGERLDQGVLSADPCSRREHSRRSFRCHSQGIPRISA